MITYTDVEFDRSNKAFTLVSEKAGNILCLEDIISIKYHYDTGILDYMYKSCSCMSHTIKKNLEKIGRFLEEMGFFKMISDSGIYHFINLNIGDCILINPSGAPNVSRDDSGYTCIHCSLGDYKRLLQKCLDDGVFVLQAKLSVWDKRPYDTSDYIEYFKKFKEMYSEKILMHLLNCNCINYDEYVNLPT